MFIAHFQLKILENMFFFFQNMFFFQPKILENMFCFLGFFFLVLNFAFLNKIVKINLSKYIVTVPVHVSTRLFDVTYLNTENYMIYIAFLQHADLKKKKKRLTYQPS